MGQKRKRKIVFVAMPCALFFIALVLVVRGVRSGSGSPASNQRAPTAAHFSAATSSLALIIEPRDGIAPVLAAIRAASSSIDLVMYELEDQQVESALAVAAERGVAVRVLLNGGYNGPTTPGTADDAPNPNNAAYGFFKAHGVAVRWTPAHFALTHQKSLIIDAAAPARRAFILSFNFTPKYYSADRDFGVIDGAINDVTEIESTFNADWNDKNIATDAAGANASDLIWSPGSRSALLALIAGAKHSIDIYNEEMADPAITQALAQAAVRGVAVRIDMTYSSEWQKPFQALSAAGANVRTYAANASLYIHAKMVLADGGTQNARAFVGSENFSAASLDFNRELGIIVADPAIMKLLSQIFNADWQGATPFRN